MKEKVDHKTNLSICWQLPTLENVITTHNTGQATILRNFINSHNTGQISIII